MAKVIIFSGILGELLVSRPKPTILAELINKKTHKSDQILEADAIWAVFYKDRPFNLKTQNCLLTQSGAKYKKNSFPNKGHAINLANKLNKLFNCEDFSVYKLTAGEKIK